MPGEHQQIEHQVSLEILNSYVTDEQKIPDSLFIQSLKSLIAENGNAACSFISENSALIQQAIEIEAEKNEEDMENKDWSIFGLLSYTMSEALKSDETSARVLFDLVNTNFDKVLRTRNNYERTNSQYLTPFLTYAASGEMSDIDRDKAEFINKVIEHYYEEEMSLTMDGHLRTAIHKHGDESTGFDKLLTSVHKSDVKAFNNLVTYSLVNRYGFSREINTNDYSEASEMLRIWKYCSGMYGRVTTRYGETEEDDTIRDLSFDEASMRIAQKIRMNFQVLERYKHGDKLEGNKLEHLRMLRRTNGIVNFNRYSLETLADQYVLLEQSEEEAARDLRPKALSILPLADHNGAFDYEHKVLDKTGKGLCETIVEASGSKDVLLRVLRSTRGTTSLPLSKRSKTRYREQPAPYDYVFIFGHGTYLGLELGVDHESYRLSKIRDRLQKTGHEPHRLDLGLLDFEIIDTILSKHVLVNQATQYALFACNTLEDARGMPEGYNFASLLARKLKNRKVYAFRSRGYSDQKIVIADTGISATKSKGGRGTDMEMVPRPVREEITGLL